MSGKFRHSDHLSLTSKRESRAGPAAKAVASIEFVLLVFMGFSVFAKNNRDDILRKP